MAKTIKAADYVIQSQVGSDKTRNKPIDPKLEKILAQVAAETGVTFVVGSGGQDAKGTPNARRTGSTRHDHGGAADVRMKGADGKFIDFNTPTGQQQWSRVVGLAKSLGVTGIGAGNNYMGGDTVHLGFGSEATWGTTQPRLKNGKPNPKWEPPPKWLTAAVAKPIPPGSIPTAVASSMDTTRSAPVPRYKPAELTAALTTAGYKPGSNPDAAIRAFQARNGLTVDGIVGDKTTAALQRVVTAKQAAPSPVASRGVVTAPQNAADPVGPGPGRFSTFTGLFDMVGGNRVPAAPRTASNAWGWKSPFASMGSTIVAAQTPSNTLPFDGTANAFLSPAPVEEVATVVDVEEQRPVRAPKIKKPYERAASGRSAASVGETFDSVWAEASGGGGNMNDRPASQHWAAAYM